MTAAMSASGRQSDKARQKTVQTEGMEVSTAFFHLEFRRQLCIGMKVLKALLLFFNFSDQHSYPIMSTLNLGRPKVHYCLSEKKKKDTVYHLNNCVFYDHKTSREYRS